MIISVLNVSVAVILVEKRLFAGATSIRFILVPWMTFLHIEGWLAHSHPDSTEQSKEHPSPFAVFQSSHCSVSG